MLTPADLRRRAERCYRDLLGRWIRGEPLAATAAVVIPVGTPPRHDLRALRAAVQALEAGARPRHSPATHVDSRQGRQDPVAHNEREPKASSWNPHDPRDPRNAHPGYRIEWHTVTSRQYGPQEVPRTIVFDAMADLVHFLGKEDEFAHLEADVALIHAERPELTQWMSEHPEKVVALHGEWSGLLSLCTYFLTHPRPDAFARAVNAPVPSKYLEQHTGILRQLLEVLLPPEHIDAQGATFAQRFGLREDEPFLRIRFLDDQLERHCGLALTDLQVPLSQCGALPLAGQRCLVTENKTTFLTLPPLPETFALFGSGYMSTLLGHIPWLVDAPLLYWGDLDPHGLQILSLVRGLFPHVQPVMMDWATFHQFFDPRRCADGVVPIPTSDVIHLTPEERDLFAHLVSHGYRVEQEHIDPAYALHALQEAILARPRVVSSDIAEMSP